MMKIILLVVTVLLLAGCVHPAIREFNAWEEVEKPRAKRGEVPWSQFYTEGYSRLEKAPRASNRADAMAMYNTMIQAAQLYESGYLTKDQFESFQRTMDIEAERSAQAQNDASRRAMGKALQDFGNKVYGPEATRARQIPTQPVPTYQAPRTTSCQTIGYQTTCTEQ